MMAGITAVSAIAIMGAYIGPKVDWGQAMYGPRWFVVFLPLLLFWAGAWLRKPHHKITWVVAGVLLAFSIAVSVIGAAAPYVRAGAGRYTVLAALHQITGSESPKSRMLQVAGR